MKAVILAGGRGTRISEESQLKPKPMIEIGGMPILWHIMKIYSNFGINEFVVCCGYKGQMIKDYFINYYTYQTDVTFSLKKNDKELYESFVEPWKVTLANTGLETQTAGRVKKIRDYLGDEPFFLTYGDGVADIDINKLLEFHKSNDGIVTITSTQPAGRFGAIKIDKKTGKIDSFKEKARVDQAWVNAGFMVMEPEVFDYLGDGSEMLENGPFESLTRDGKMYAYKHDGFWSPMDTLRDKNYLEELCKSGDAPWKVW